MKKSKLDLGMLIVGILIILVGLYVTITKFARVPEVHYFNGKYAMHAYEGSVVYIISIPLVIFGVFVVYKSFKK